MKQFEGRENELMDKLLHEYPPDVDEINEINEMKGGEINKQEEENKPIFEEGRGNKKLFFV